MTFLLDTCVVSEAARPLPEPRVAAWMDAQDPLPMYLSAVSVGELIQGISRLRDKSRADALRSWVTEKLLPRFEGRILRIDLAVAQAWGELRGTAMANGRTPAVIDSMIAATAHVHGLTVVTRNTKDFSPLGINVVNPWDDPDDETDKNSKSR